MIAERELRQAIAECQGERNPNANTCLKLAAYYTILSNISEKTPEVIALQSDSEFAQAVKGCNPAIVWTIMDDLMQTLAVTTPRLYEKVIQQIKDRG